MCQGQNCYSCITNLCVINYNQTSVLSVCQDFRILVICLERGIGINNVDFLKTMRRDIYLTFQHCLLKLGLFAVNYYLTFLTVTLSNILFIMCDAILISSSLAMALAYRTCAHLSQSTHPQYQGIFFLKLWINLYSSVSDQGQSIFATQGSDSLSSSITYRSYHPFLMAILLKK